MATVEVKLKNGKLETFNDSNVTYHAGGFAIIKNRYNEETAYPREDVCEIKATESRGSY